jgi:class 3 adenylate cyclase
MFVLAMLAGVFIGLGGTFMLLVKSDANLGFAASSVLGGVVFSLGLFSVVVAGAELFTEGDSFFVAFGDAAGAVAACVAAQRALAAYPWPSADATPRVRMGLHTGWATPVAGEYTSAEVHRAARVASAAHGGQVLCSKTTAQAVSTWSPGPALREDDFALLSASLIRETASLSRETASVAREAGSGRESASRGRESGPVSREGASPGRESVSVGSVSVVSERPSVSSGSRSPSRDTAGTHRQHRSAQAALIDNVDLLDLGPFRLRGFDDDERLFQVVAPGLERAFPPPRTPGAPVDNLPAPVTAFIGRQSPPPSVLA